MARITTLAVAIVALLATVGLRTLEDLLPTSRHQRRRSPSVAPTAVGGKGAEHGRAGGRG